MYSSRSGTLKLASSKMEFSNTNIVRNRSKIQSAITNARAFIKVQREFGSFDDYIWRFAEGGKTKHNFFKNYQQVPVRSVESDNLSKDLRTRGFSFVGSTICYAMMQAAFFIQLTAFDIKNYLK